MEDIKKQITDQIANALLDYDIKKDQIKLIHPELQHGDFTTNAALIFSKQAGKSARELAEQFLQKLQQLSFVESAVVAGSGFININLNEKIYFDMLRQVISDPHRALTFPKHEGKKVIVEYSSPNIAKPFTIGHLRSTIIGDAIANLLDATGWTVYRDNHIGDWGTQFGKQIYAIKEWGNEEEIEKSENPIKELVALYVKFHEEAEKDPSLEDKAREWFKKLEDGDEEARRLWKKTVDWSWKEFSRIYDQLHVNFTENNGKGFGESFFEDKMQAVIEELRSKNLLTESEGAQVVFFPNDELPPLMVVKKDGATLYATRDLATDKFRRELYGPDVKIVNEVGAEQSLYFQQLYQLESLLEWYNIDQRVHVKHGLYRFKDQKMSTRKGNVIWLEDVIQEAETRAREKARQASRKIDTESSRLWQTIGVGAIKWNDLKRSSHMDITFDWDEILNMEGNSGPYMQYTYARTQSVLRKAEDTYQVPEHFNKVGLQKEEKELLQLFSQYKDVLQESSDRFAPNVLATYLYKVGQLYNLFYQKYPILKNSDENVKNFRLALTEAAGIIIKNGLGILGIQAPEKM